MSRWASIALAVAALGYGAAEEGQRADAPQMPKTCELGSADRARTPSVRCMGCHDGVVGKGVGFEMAPDGRGMSHPVEVNYAAIAARNPTRYHPAGSLPPELPLVNGRIACTTCHDGASPDPKRVVVVPRLCESCHKM